jgi:gliding motility-associated protein GldM
MNDQKRKNIVYGVLAFFGLALLALPFYLYNSTYSFEVSDILVRFSIHVGTFLTAILAGTFAVHMIGKAASTAATKIGTTVVAKIGTTVVAPLLLIASGAAVTSYSVLKKPENLNNKMTVEVSKPTFVQSQDTTALDSTSGYMKVTQLVPMVIPKASLVAAGDTYAADVFIASAISGQPPQMFYNGKKITVTEDPQTKILKGKIEFPASANAYDPKTGVSKQTFKARIEVQGQSYENDIEYSVVKPVIRITTGNAPTLYLNCGNVINIEVPALGTYYKPTFSATGARIFTSERAGRITIVPTEMKVNVSVLNDGKLLGIEPFDVKRIPRPTVVCRDQVGRVIDLKIGAQIVGLTQLRISVEPDENFKNNVPKDAVYRVRLMEVILRRGVTYVNTMTVNSELVDLSGWRALLRPGDAIVCNIKSVTRLNYLNEEEVVDITPNNYQLISLQ